MLHISDVLVGGDDQFQPLVDAATLVRQVTGARLAPIFLMSDTGQDHVLVADEEQRAALGAEFVALPVEPYVREPWLNHDEVPVWGREQPEAWAALPPAFQAAFAPVEVCVPIHADGRHFGAMLLAFDADVDADADLRAFLAVVGRVLGNAVYRRQTARRERELGALEERRRLSEELHVELSQQVAAVGLQVGLVQMDLGEPDAARLTADVAHLDEMVEGLKQSLRAQMLGLRADAELVTGSLEARVREQVEAFRRLTDLTVTFECSGSGAAGGVPPFVAAQLVRVLQEALANVRLHAHASTVVVRLAPSTAGIRLEVEDDGVGFDRDAVLASRLGLRIMAERLAQVDGVVRFETAPSAGTRVVAEAPLRPRDTGGVQVEEVLRRG